MSHHEELEADLIRTKKRIEQILKEIGKNKHIGKIEIKGIDWIPSCALIITDRDKTNAEIRAKVYPLVLDTPLPFIKTHTIVYKRHEPDVAEYFINHFNVLWENSKLLMNTDDIIHL